MASDAGAANICSEVVGLRAFLRSRCGSLQAAFYALDVHSVGQLTSDDFVKGLKRLGYAADAAAVFHTMNEGGNGLLSQLAFIDNLGGDANCSSDVGVNHVAEIAPRDSLGRFGAERETMLVVSASRNSNQNTTSQSPERGKAVKSPSAFGASGVAAWKNALSPSRAPWEGQLLQSGGAKHSRNYKLAVPLIADSGFKRAGSADGARAPERSTVPEDAIARADLYARFGRVEEQLQGEAKLQQEVRTRLMAVEGQLNKLATETCTSQQLEGMRQQLADERKHWWAELQALRADMEASARNLGRGEEVEALVRHELSSALAEVRPQVEGALKTVVSTRMDEVSRTLAELRPQMERALETFINSRLAAFENLAAAKAESSSPMDRKEHDPETLWRNVETMQGKLEGLEHAIASVEQLATSANERGAPPNVEALLDGRIAAFRAEIKSEFGALEEKRWSGCARAEASPETEAALTGGFAAIRVELLEELRAALNEERQRSCERAQALGRVLGGELESAVVAQAVAEAKAEVRTLISDEIEGLRGHANVVAAAEAAVVRERALRAKAESNLNHDCEELARLSKSIDAVQPRLESLEGSVPVLSEQLKELDGKIGDIVVSNERRSAAKNACRAQMQRQLETVDECAEGPSAAGSGPTAEALVELRCLDEFVRARLASVEQGFALLQHEQKELADRMADSDTKRQNEAETVQRKLQALIIKLDTTCTDGRSAASSLGAVAPHSAKKGAQRRAESRGTHSVPTPGFVYRDRAVASPLGVGGGASIAGMNSSRPLLSLRQPQEQPATGFELDVTTEAIGAIQALREENARLREENTEMRKNVAAAQGHACPDAEVDAQPPARSASPVRAKPSSSVASAVPGGTPTLLGHVVGAVSPQHRAAKPEHGQPFKATPFGAMSSKPSTRGLAAVAATPGSISPLRGPSRAFGPELDAIGASAVCVGSPQPTSRLGACVTSATAAA
eukprot:CAMPEP_0117464634 /NCGR_PEP_ID=MMETSP0784-20121206/4204_1 /TAXON_ID=39447 /ORGANISM="" /LENGTH=971 /DNA_ID=CAMNT_0005258503 /DNA_START=27 /DNA_END=2939 /DNA_ORIENTATION=-